MKLLRTDNSNPDFIQLCADLDRELNKRYGISQSKYDNHNIIEENKTVLVGYINTDPVACGCFKPMDEKTIEIKRMFVKSTHRRQGLSSEILLSLEGWAIESGYCQALLETGKGQPEAINLYKKYDYHETEKYGPYVELENSICMIKTLKV